MNDLVRASIEARKNAILSTYEIEDNVILNEIEDLFNRIYQFGESCVDSMDFETKFANSPLNKEYIELYTKIATNCTQKVVEEVEAPDVKSDGEYILEDFTSEVKYQMEDATQPIRGRMYREAYDKARDIPIVGEALNVKQHIDFFSKFKKKKEDDENEED